MGSILETFGLKKNLNLTVKMEKSEFTQLLEQKVKPNRLFFFDIFDSQQKEFYGNVNKDSFWLRLGSKSITGGSFASANGKIKYCPKKTEMNISIIGWNWFILLWFLGISLIFGLVFIDALKKDSFGLLAIFGPVFLIFYLIGILKIRNGVKRFEKFITSEFITIENKNVLQHRV
ncbi:hypothetical protein [Kordia jejudonensis]|uniref:hypothetical protein n=1 Tax=Kordia jejudonensis TaxID=1348245 RepID=UPI0006295E75|nr:hypothetical protein [Kordia jejudonensis]